ncbi:MAG: hypothetical protein IJ682_12680 [Lachnospiraceae bacterium]|nr:hypothetical protein [Lachnospiraceae bacterium]
MNPMELLKLKDKVGTFQREHPKMLPFFKTIHKKALAEGNVLEIKAIAADGKEYVSNIRMTANDMEIVRMLGELGK